MIESGLKVSEFRVAGTAAATARGRLSSNQNEVIEMSKSLTNCEDLQRDRVAEKRQYQCLYCIFFFVFFWVALCSRLLPRSIRPLASTARGGESVWQEASRATQTAVGFAFMG